MTPRKSKPRSKRCLLDANPEGDHIFSFEFIPTGKADVANGKGVPATIKLLVDGDPVGSGNLPVTIPLQLGLSAGVCVSADSGAPIMDADYEAPFPFSGTVKKVLVDITGEAVEDKAAKSGCISLGSEGMPILMSASGT